MGRGAVSTLHGDVEVSISIFGAASSDGAGGVAGLEVVGGVGVSVFEDDTVFALDIRFLGLLLVDFSFTFAGDWLLLLLPLVDLRTSGTVCGVFTSSSAFLGINFTGASIAVVDGLAMGCCFGGRPRPRFT